MTATRLPDLEVPAGRRLDLAALEARLRERVDGEVRFDDGSRATYATDASNYRQVPIAVVVPRSLDAGTEALRVCAEFGAPVLSRGGGTSLAGECCNVAVVIDWSKYCRAVESIDPEARTAVVQAGTVLDAINAAAGEHDLMVGPKPATHGHCTIGGMIGNNSCGATAQAYGKTVDILRRLEIVCPDGHRLWVGPGDEIAADDPDARACGERMREGLVAIATEYADDIHARFVDIPRRVSGYNLDDLLPDRRVDLAKALSGSESTLVTVLRAEIELVPTVPEQDFVAIGFPDVFAAADAVPLVAHSEPILLEAIDSTLVDHEKSKHLDPKGLRELPEGGAWLLVQLGGADRREVDRRTRTLLASLEKLDDPPSSTVIRDPADQEAILAVREDALGATAWVIGEHATWPGWEDAAVPPDRLGDYLRDFRDLLEEFGLASASLYGHFGHGCVHTRIPFDLSTLRGVAAYRRFVERAAHLVVDYGGSLSGEHGDGQARGELLPIMFGPRVMEAFRRVKTLIDPENRMNPGKVVDPLPLDAELRLGADYAPPLVEGQQFAYPEDRGEFANAAVRCVGVGKCRNHSGGVMCPSYRATGEEEHSTRGRARLLFEMMNGPAKGGPIEDVWRSDEVRDALDLCLACKGCRSDCPVDVDMATYKAEFLSHHYEGRLRPANHYSMGWLPFWLRLARFAPRRLLDRIGHWAPVAALAKRVGGIEPDRVIPHLAPETYHRWMSRRRSGSSALRGDVVLWPDSFNESLTPGVARAAVEVLEDAGYRVLVPDAGLCCGLTWVTTGQLDHAKRELRRTAAALRPFVDRGIPVVGLEPSCTAVFRVDGPELLADDEDVHALAGATKTLAELLESTTGWNPPRVEADAVVQPHCHQYSVLGFDAERSLMERAGIRVTEVGGCCGLAGNYGFEAGHLDVSVAAAETEILPAVRAAGDDAVVLADGFSCRTQVEQAGGERRPVHLAELLAAAIRGESEWGDRVENRIADRPAPLEAIPEHRRGVVPWVRAEAGS